MHVICNMSIVTQVTTEQYQYCLNRRKDSELCSEFKGIRSPFSNTDNAGGDPSSGAELADASPVQLAAVQTIALASTFMGLQMAMLAKFEDRELNYGTITSLPDDHWTREITYWDQIMWASLQIAVSDYAVGWGVQEPIFEPYVKKDLTSGYKELCQTQRRLKTGGFV